MTDTAVFSRTMLILEELRQSTFATALAATDGDLVQRVSRPPQACLAFVLERDGVSHPQARWRICEMPSRICGRVIAMLLIARAPCGL